MAGHPILLSLKWRIIWVGFKQSHFGVSRRIGKAVISGKLRNSDRYRHSFSDFMMTKGNHRF